MIETQASRTAMMVAGYRARATARENPVCDDRWAAALAGDHGIELSHRFDASFPHMELWMAVRTAYLDAQVRAWSESFSQVVLLGAGLDTRAARLARAGVRFFEVDHPATQAHKRERLAAADGYPMDAATFAPCDFEREDFLDRLAAAGFDADAPAVIVWEGVVPYLTEPAVRGTLHRVAAGCHPHTVLLFDYLMKRMGEGAPDLPEHDKQTRQMVADLGEPVQFGINDPVPLLYEEGFCHVRAISFNEICLSLTGTYDRARMFRFQHVALASRHAHTVL
jgi:methyltransferase (TIGR00027 family)